MKTTDDARSSKETGEIQLSNCDFQKISKIAKNDYGLNLEESKRPLVKSRLSKRIRILGLNNFTEYCNLIEAKTAQERDDFVASLTTNVTHFYREKHHFDMLENVILPNLHDNSKKGRPIRIWSAGCSSGQEPYSIAGSILSALPDATRLDIEITATDLDPKILSKAQAGAYRSEDCRFPSDDHSKRIFSENSTNSKIIEVRPEVRSLVSFSRLNLIDIWPEKRFFDIIFCRNVAIYFDKVTQERLWIRFVDRLRSGGHLFIGHSERISGESLRSLTSVGITSYQKFQEIPTYNLSKSQRFS